MDIPQGALDALSSGSSSSSDNLPQGALDALSDDSSPSFSDSFKSTARTLNDSSGLSSFVTGFGQGAAQSIEGMANLILKLAGDKPTLDKASSAEKSQDQFFQDINPGDTSNILPNAAKLGNAAGQSAPFVAGGEVPALAKIGEGVGKLGTKVAEAFGLGGKYGKLVGQLVARGAGGAGMGAVAYDPDNNQGQNAFLGMALNAVGIPVTGKIAETLASPRKFFGTLAGKLSRVKPEDIKKAIDSGDPQLVGGVLNLPTLKKFETNSLPTTIFSAYTKHIQDIAQALGKRANKLVLGMANGAKENANKMVRKFLTKHSDEIEGQNTNNYAAMRKASGADQLSYKHYFNRAGRLSEQQGGALAAGGIDDEMGILGKLNQIVKTGNAEDLGKLSNIAELTPNKVADHLEDLIKNPPKRPAKAPDRSLQTTNFLRSILGNFQEKAVRDGDMRSASVWGQLKGALDEDIDDYLDQPGKEHVRKAYDHAQNFFKQEVAPFRQADLQKYISGKNDTDTLVSHFLLGDKNRLNKLQELIKTAPGAEPYILQQAFAPALEENLATGEKNYNPGKVAAIIKKIGPDRMRVLLKNDPKKIAKVQDYSDTYDINKDSLKSLDNTFNGFQQIADQNVREGLSNMIKIADKIASKKGIKETVGDVFRAFYGIPASFMLKNPQFLRYAYEARKGDPTSVAAFKGWLGGFGAALISQLAQAGDS